MSGLSSLVATPAPKVAVEMTRHRVSAAVVDWRGGRRVVSAHAAQALPAGALVPSLTADNVRDRAAVLAALRHVFAELGGRPRRIGLVLPDVVARVSLVRFEQMPGRVEDLDQLVRWQVRKAAPFPAEEAQVSWVPGAQTSGEGHEFVVAVARRAVIEEYERLAGEAGADAGLVDLSTFNVINAILAGATDTAGDWLLVHVSADYASVAIVRNAHLIFFRNRVAEADGTLADLVHQTAMYYEDRLKGGGFTRVVLAGASGEGDGSLGRTDGDEVRRSLEERLAQSVDFVDPRAAAAITDRIVASPALLEMLAPLVGLLVRDQPAPVGAQ